MHDNNRGIVVDTVFPRGNPSSLFVLSTEPHAHGISCIHLAQPDAHEQIASIGGFLQQAQVTPPPFERSRAHGAPTETIRDGIGFGDLELEFFAPGLGEGR